MTTEKFILSCKSAIYVALDRKHLSMPHDLSVVWLSKALQNRKATFANVEDKEDSRYWEVTYNGDEDEYYVDTYIKLTNECVSLWPGAKGVNK